MTSVKYKENVQLVKGKSVCGNEKKKKEKKKKVWQGQVLSKLKRELQQSSASVQSVT